jgi:hypothetical protein
MFSGSRREEPYEPRAGLFYFCTKENGAMSRGRGRAQKKAQQKPTEEIEFLKGATKCPVCFQETENRLIVAGFKGETMGSMPICSEAHMAIFMKKISAQPDVETRKHVTTIFTTATQGNA